MVTVIMFPLNAGPILSSTGEFEGLVTIINDISANINAQNELVKAKELAEESDRLKSAFLANMSHEIRTPMNGIIGFSGLLSKDNLSEEKRSNYVRIIQNSTTQLLTIITDILDVSKIEAGLLSIYEQKFNLNDMFDELHAQFEIEKKQKFKEEIELKIHKGLENIEAEIFSDRARIYQVISNLIGNAIKFTEKGTIEFGYKVINKEKIIFFVKDTGIGIDREKQSIIFERFRQVDDSTNRKYGGTGLGLAICKGLVSLLGGKIWVESNPGSGSVFYFSLNYKPITAYSSETHRNSN